MAKPSHRAKILTEGLRVVHARGFSGASVRDICDAAGVPLGSFTNHFTSKEAFALEVLNLYNERIRATARQTLHNDSLSPLQRLRAWVDAIDTALNQNDAWHGCLVGNFSAGVNECHETIRRRLVEIFAEMQRSVADCLVAAVKAEELPPTTECAELAGFMIASMQGALLQSKAERSSIPMNRYKHFIFSTVLRV